MCSLCPKSVIPNLYLHLHPKDYREEQCVVSVLNQSSPTFLYSSTPKIIEKNSVQFVSIISRPHPFFTPPPQRLSRRTVHSLCPISVIPNLSLLLHPKDYRGEQCVVCVLNQSSPTFLYSPPQRFLRRTVCSLGPKSVIPILSLLLHPKIIEKNSV